MSLFALLQSFKVTRKYVRIVECQLINCHDRKR